MRVALQQVIEDNAGWGYQVAGTNLDFDPLIGTPYLRSTLLPSEPINNEIGSHQGVHTGVFQIDLYRVLDTGVGQSLTDASVIKQAYEAADPLGYGGTQVRVLSVGIGQGVRDNPWYTLPVEIRFQSIF